MPELLLQLPSTCQASPVVRTRPGADRVGVLRAQQYVSQAARRPVTVVKGQPLHLRQCAALAREGKHSLRSLAEQASHNPEILDQHDQSAEPPGFRG